MDVAEVLLFVLAAIGVVVIVRRVAERTVRVPKPHPSWSCAT